MLTRSAINPIIRAHTDLAWCSKKVYNAAVFKEKDQYVMLFRAVGDDWISRLGLATSSDGVNFTVMPEPVFTPQHDWEKKGCEDPRVTKIGDTYWVAYTAFDGVTARAAVTSTQDFKVWGERHLLFPEHQHDQREELPGEWSKAAAIFPEKINGKYCLFFGDNHIWLAQSDNLIDWKPVAKPIVSGRDGLFDGAYVEMGPPPIKTDHGWLVLYHGIDEFSENRVYSLGAVLLDINDASRVLWRSSTPILTPHEKYETMGLIDIVAGGFSTLQNMNLHGLIALAEQKRLPKAIFCCGAVLEDDQLRIYYGAADTVICTATIDLATLFAG